jgi:predicted nucleic acid-binding protein
MEVILDTNGLSAWLDGDEGLKLRLITVAGVWLSPIVLGEYRFGIKASRHREVYELKLADLEMDIPTLPIDAATSES